jgi:hypothetical protein
LRALSDCTITANQAVGSAGGPGANGGNGFGGGLYNDGQSTLTILGSSIAGNQADGGADGSGSTGSLGDGGGLYVADGGVSYIEMFTSTNLSGNTASTSDNDIFGAFTTC